LRHHKTLIENEVDFDEVTQEVVLIPQVGLTISSSPTPMTKTLLSGSPTMVNALTVITTIRTLFGVAMTKTLMSGSPTTVNALTLIAITTTLFGVVICQASSLLISLLFHIFKIVSHT